ncbi:cell wall protein [Colletotrichum tabaci]|uniref:Cell wall protein n=1 Tax=Colletotrichum tabaci TaxID=1209068 RepID=A0AAV9TB82_9PEZI
MKFFAPIVLLAAGAIAAPSPSELCERELSTVNTIMTTVLNGIQSLDGSICAYSGGPGKELEDASATMLTIIRTATYNAAAMLPLTMDEAIAFQPLSDQLNAAGDKLLVDLSNKVPLFAKSGACDSTLTWVAQVGGNVNTLMTTISTKFPAGGKGGDEITHFNGIFAEMQDKLSTCSTGGKGSGSGSGTKIVDGNGTQGNGTRGGSPTSTIRPVVTAGAALMTISGAGLAAAVAAFIL